MSTRIREYDYPPSRCEYPPGDAQQMVDDDGGGEGGGAALRGCEVQRGAHSHDLLTGGRVAGGGGGEGVGNEKAM